MGRSQPAVSDFERLGGDPHLSTIRRYALAIGVEVIHAVAVPGSTSTTSSAPTRLQLRPAGLGVQGETTGSLSVDLKQAAR
ncbi:hypothetical protein [Nonomuraea sp. NPDC049784]|uniref:hypothetical protein n=1 Tax=Nonomuraea sp. NPDC049784 TaxID=3154361 RepID=UPI0033CA4D0F